MLQIDVATLELRTSAQSQSNRVQEGYWICNYLPSFELVSVNVGCMVTDFDAFYPMANPIVQYDSPFL